MSRKLSAVEINDFRIYEGIHFFDFKIGDSDKIADLVVLYAPNGYGKTSFFDAIEWAVTGEIGRISGNKTILEEVSRERGAVLRNRNSSKKFGSVELRDNHDGILTVKTKEIKGNMHHDYKPGELVKNEFGELRNLQEDFCNTNFLAHDKITSFLQQYSSDDKYEALAIFWDGKKDTEILNQIKEIEKEIEKCYSEKKDQIKKAREELKEFEFEEDKIKETSDKIEKLNIKENDLNLICNIEKDLKGALEACDEKEHILKSKKVKYNEKLQKIRKLLGECSSYEERKKQVFRISIKYQYYCSGEKK